MSHTREDAWSLLTEYTTSDSLRKHALAVEAAMREMAPVYGGDPDAWGLTGLLHDFDYERWPQAPDHPQQGIAILRAQQWPEEMLEAIAGHADYLNVPRNTPMAKALYAVDDLCGFVTAVAYVRPSRKLADVTVSSVRKKLKDHTFARAVSREEMARAAEDLSMPLETVIAHCLAGMQRIAEKLGL